MQQIIPLRADKPRRKISSVPTEEAAPTLTVPPEVLLGYRLWQAHYQWHRHIERCFKTIDLTHMQYVLLAATYHLLSQGETPSQIRLSNFTNVEKMMVSKNVRVLERRGLVARKPLPGDRRANQIQLTDTGREMLQKAFAVTTAAHSDFFHVLGDEWKQVNKLLRHLIHSQPDRLNSEQGAFIHHSDDEKSQRPTL
jgi:DNA-binding MarR family transcriptional regulator